VAQGLDDWIFSWDYVHERRPDVDARLERFADVLVAQARDASFDEIVIVGHSLGATLAIEVVARALKRDENLGRHGPSICVLTVGSTIPKFSLHPAGEHFRRCAASIVSEPSIAWAEYHARADAISFYKFHPVTLSRFYGDQMTGKPVCRRVRLHLMLRLRTYLRYRLRFMRLHYQFVMANERRTAYDYFMMVCGPIPFARSVLTSKGPAELIAADGALIDPAAPVPVMPPASGNAALTSEPKHDRSSR
jgi:pimeloyl-ACP methyl ester carboxylesterase